ncbi:MAG: hypothetical protein OIF51_16005 [Cellvibrionaceae bacterium]|nr:hypothetical protein [Cellvibrionaceae bacterium]
MNNDVYRPPSSDLERVTAKKKQPVSLLGGAIQITDFRWFRLFWLLFAIPYLLLVFDLVIDSFSSEPMLRTLSLVVSLSVALAVLPYILGLKVFSRKFWQFFLVATFIEEHHNLFSELQAISLDIVMGNVMATTPMFIIFLYAFTNKSIWTEIAREEKINKVSH